MMVCIKYQLLVTTVSCSKLKLLEKIVKQCILKQSLIISFLVQP